MEYLVLSIGQHLVTAARFGFSGRSAALVGAVSFDLGETATLEELAARIAQGVSGSPRIVLCLPPTLFAQRVVELPLSDLRKVREILPAHLQGEMALSAEEAVFDALPVAEGAFLALWARRAEVAAAIELFKAAGCEPQVVSALPFGWQHLPGLPADCVVCDGAALAVVRSGRLSFVRALDDGDISRQLGATLSALQLSGMVLPEGMYVYGEHAAAISAADNLPLKVHLLELPTEVAAVFRTEKAFQQLAGLYAVARACHAGGLPDFRRGGLAWTAGDAKLRRQVSLTALLVATAVVLMFVSGGLRYRAALADIASLNGSIAAIYREIFPTRAKAVDELAEVKGEIRRLAGSGGQNVVLDVLKQVAEAKGAAVNGLFEVELEGRTLRIKGEARSVQGVNEFKGTLAGILAAVDAGEIKTRPDGTVSFTLSGTLKEVAK